MKKIIFLSAVLFVFLISFSSALTATIYPKDINNWARYKPSASIPYSFGSSTIPSLDYYNSVSDFIAEYHPFLTFDWSANIPLGSTINSATLYYYVTSDDWHSSYDTVARGEIPNTACSDLSAYDCYFDILDNAVSTLAGTSSYYNEGWHNVPVTKFAQSMTNRKMSIGWGIIDIGNYNGEEEISFTGATNINKPYILVDYTPHIPAISIYSSSPPGSSSYTSGTWTKNNIQTNFACLNDCDYIQSCDGASCTPYGSLGNSGSITISSTLIKGFRGYSNTCGAGPIKYVNYNIDSAPPSITLNGANPQQIEAGTSYTELGASANDAREGVVSVIPNALAVNTNLIGDYNVIYTASDSLGNIATATRTVKVKDTTIPIITLLGNVVENIDIGGAYTDAGATASDNYDGNLTANIIVNGSVDTNKVGVYTLNYNVADSSGNSAVQITRTINVVDTTAPIITLNGNAIVNLTQGDNYTDAGAIATDNVDGDLTANISVSGNVDIINIGTYTLSYDVNDSSGNKAIQVTRMINVNPAPVKPDAPNVTNDDTANTISEITAGMEYDLDNAGYVVYDSLIFNAIDFSGDHTLLIRISAEGINPASDPITLTFTTNPVIQPPSSSGGGGGGGGGSWGSSSGYSDSSPKIPTNNETIKQPEPIISKDPATTEVKSKGNDLWVYVIAIIFIIGAIVFLIYKIRSS
jgi:hypothetical protein